MQKQTTLAALLAAIERSLAELERHADAEGRSRVFSIRPILVRRRRAHAALRAFLRGNGRVSAGPKRPLAVPPTIEAGAPTLFALIQSERRLLALYDAVRSLTGDSSPEAHLLGWQRAESEDAIRRLSAAVSTWPAIDGARRIAEG